MANSTDPSRLRRLLAWCAHFYTALGLAAAAGMAILIVRGGGESFRDAFLLMLIACAIDATDGTFARLVGVKSVLPGFDGAKLDDIIDFLTYTFLPLLLIWRADLLPAGLNASLLLPLFASAYGFSQVNAKTADGYFLGFPSYWNLVAFYLYVLKLPSWLAVAILVVLALLTFVPTRYLYPSRRCGRLNLATDVLGGLWAVLMVAIIFAMPPRPILGVHVGAAELNLLVMASLVFPAYYMIASWVISWHLWRKGVVAKSANGSCPS